MGKIGLSSDVKSRMRNELSGFADFHAVRVVEDARSIDEVQRTSVFTLFANSQLRFMKATLLIALMVGMGGTSFAAQAAVPGDFLYPVKIHVNENVRSSLAVGADAQAKLQADLLEERLEEAQKLAAKGELQGEVAADVNVGITAQLQKTLATAAKADATTNAEVKAEVAGTLATFTSDLQNMGTSVDTDVVADITSDINTYIAGMLDAGVNGALGIELAGEISIETIVNRASERLASLENTIAASAEMNAQIKSDFEAKLEEAGAFITDAQAEVKANAEAQAEANAEKANDILGAIESALSLMGEVKIDENTGHIIDIDFSGTSSAGAGVNGSNDGTSEIEAILEGGADASLQNDMIDGQLESESSVTGSLGI